MRSIVLEIVLIPQTELPSVIRSKVFMVKQQEINKSTWALNTGVFSDFTLHQQQSGWQLQF